MTSFFFVTLGRDAGFCGRAEFFMMHGSFAGASALVGIFLGAAFTPRLVQIVEAF
jgi:hypothetical protein